LLALYSFTSYFSVVTALLGFDITFFITCVAGIVFPFRHKTQFDNSDGNTRFHGFPVLSICGIAGALGVAGIIVILLLDPNSGTSIAHNKKEIYGDVVAFAVGVIIYLVAARIQRSRGVDVRAAYRTLPVE
jgi:hypothetical protein